MGSFSILYHKALIALLICGMMMMAASAESYLYVSQEKTINGSFKYYLPKLEINQAKLAGKFFGDKCFYLSEIELGLVYTAPRSSAFHLNHHSIEAAWNFGLEVGLFWATYSIGARDYIDGNDDGTPAGLEAYNSARIGIKMP